MSVSDATADAVLQGPGGNDGSSFFQDYILLNGLRSPGRADVLSADGLVRSWDERKGYGFSGAFLVYTGDGLPKFTVRLTLWAPPDLFVEWTPFAQQLALSPKGLVAADYATFALGIGHPVLNAPPWSISSVVVESVGLPIQDDDGLWTIDIKFIVYRAPAPALGKPDKTIPSIEGKGAEQSGSNFGGDTSPGAATLADLNDQIATQQSHP